MESLCRCNKDPELFLMHMYIRHTVANIKDMMTRQMQPRARRESYKGNRTNQDVADDRPTIPKSPTQDAAAMGIALQPLCDAVEESEEFKESFIQIGDMAKEAAALSKFELETRRRALLDVEMEKLFQLMEKPKETQYAAFQLK